MTMLAYNAFMALVERNLVPDAVLRAGIRRNLRVKCRETFANTEDELEHEQKFIEELRTRSDIAIETAAANEQHYEVPTEFYLMCLGNRLKYSCCLYRDGKESLDEAEVAMLQTYSARAELVLDRPYRPAKSKTVSRGRHKAIRQHRWHSGQIIAPSADR